MGSFPSLVLIFGTFGAIIGSFIGATVLRLPRGETIVAGRSHCDACRKTLSARELIPILSYVLQRGRCRICRAPIAIDQPIAEWGGLAVGIIAAISTSSLPAAAMLALFGWALVALALLDARHFWLPDAITLPLIPLGLVSVVAIPEISLRARVAGAILGFGMLEALRRIYRLCRGREGLGAGDAKLLGAIGAWLGVSALPWIVLSAATLGLVVVGIGRLRHGQGRLIERLPLGTLLAVVAIAATPVIFCLVGGVAYG